MIIPKRSDPTQPGPHWHLAGNAIAVTCDVGHVRMIDRSLIVGSELPESLALPNGCSASLRCPRERCSFHHAQITLAGHEP